MILCVEYIVRKQHYLSLSVNFTSLEAWLSLVEFFMAKILTMLLRSKVVLLVVVINSFITEAGKFFLNFD